MPFVNIIGLSHATPVPNAGIPHEYLLNISKQENTMLKDKTGRVLTRSEGEAVMKGRGAITISILAAMLAIVTLISNSNSSRVLTNNIMSNDTWAFYQAKSIKQSVYELSAEQVVNQLQGQTTLTAAERADLQKRLEKYQAAVARYESDPVSGEGKKELMARAHRLESERDAARQRSPWLSFSSALIQIGIVLSSTAILAVSMALLWSSVAAGGLGVALFVLGMFLNLPWPL